MNLQMTYSVYKPGQDPFIRFLKIKANKEKHFW